MGDEWQVVLLFKRRLQTHQSSDAWVSFAEEFMTSDRSFTLAKFYEANRGDAGAKSLPCPKAFLQMSNRLPSKQFSFGNGTLIK